MSPGDREARCGPGACHTPASRLSPGGRGCPPVSPRPAGREHGSPCLSFGSGVGSFHLCPLRGSSGLGSQETRVVSLGGGDCPFLASGSRSRSPRHSVRGAGPQRQEGLSGSIAKSGSTSLLEGSLPLGKQVGGAGDSVLVSSPGWAARPGPGSAWALWWKHLAGSGELHRSPGWSRMVSGASPALSPAWHERPLAFLHGGVVSGAVPADGSCWTQGSPAPVLGRGPGRAGGRCVRAWPSPCSAFWPWGLR